MAKLLGFGILLVGLVLALPEQVQSQAKTGNVTKATAQDYKNLERLKEWDKVTIVSANTKTVTVRVPGPPQVQATGKYKTGVKATATFKEYEFDLVDEVVVRKTYVTPDYDDKGNFKTNEELSKELRKNGFIASKIEDIQSGNIAKLFFAPVKKTSDKKDDGDAPRRSVTKIVLEADGKGPVAGATPPPKKKKDS